MIKKLLLCIIMFSFMISFTSALDWDNVMRYEKEDMKVVFENTWGFDIPFMDDTLGSLELKSHKNVYTPKGVPIGEDRLHMYYDFENWDGGYIGGLGEVIIKNMKTGKIIKKDYSFKQAIYETTNEPIYKTTMAKKLLKNGTVEDVYSDQVIGYEDVTRVKEWVVKTDNNIPKGNSTIAVFMDMEDNTHLDLIWTVAGKQISKHAEVVSTPAVDTWLDNGNNRVGNAGVEIIYEASDYTINNATFHGGVLPNRCRICDDKICTTTYDTGTLVGNVCVFDYEATANTTYLILSDKGGSGYNNWLGHDGSFGAGYLPQTVNDLTWVQSWNYNGVSSDTYFINFDSITYEPISADQPPVVTLEDPENNTAFFTSMIDFSCYGSDDIGFSNMSFILNGVVDQTNTTGLNNTNYTFQKSLSAGDYNYTCKGTDNNSQSTQPDVYYFNVTVIAPDVTLQSPISSYNSTTISNDLTAFVTSPDALANVSLIQNGTRTQTNSSAINNSNHSFVSTFPDGSHTWTFEACDTDNECDTPTVRTINIDTTPFIEFITPPTLVNYANVSQEYIPMKVNISTPYFQNITYSLRNVNGTNYTQTYTNQTLDINFTDQEDAHYHYDVTICTTTDQCNTTETRHINHDASPPTLSSASNLTNLTTFDPPINSTWTYNASDPAINTCYYNTTENPTYEVITCNSTINTTWSDRGYKTIQYCADDTFGNEQCNQETIFIFWIEDTIGSDRSSVAEGFNVVFNLTINLTGIGLTTAQLNLNNTIYEPTTTEAGLNGYYFERTVFIPTGWGLGDGADFDWYWNYTIDGEVTDRNSSHENLTVYTLDIDDCSVYDETILNFTLRDEKTSALINASAGTNVELDVTLQSKIFEDVILTHSITYTNENNPVACIPSLNESQYWIDITMGYDSTDHVWEFFYLEDGTLNSSKIFDAQTTSEIDLYNLQTVDSTSFLFNFFDLDGLSVDDTIVHVFRQYIGEGQFKEVERSKADQNGETIVHLVEEDVIYYFLITQYGIPIYTSSQYTALCQSTPCEIQIEESGESASFPTDWDLLDNGGYDISSSASTREVSLAYQFNETETINLTVFKYNSDGSYSAINTSGATGTSGVIVLSVPQSAGNVSFFASVDQNTNHINSEWVDFSEKAQDRFGVVLSLFLAGVIILTLALFAVNEGVGTIAYVILGVFVSGALGLISIDLSTGVSIIAYLVSAGALLIWKLTRRRP